MIEMNTYNYPINIYGGNPALHVAKLHASKRSRKSKEKDKKYDTYI